MVLRDNDTYSDAGPYNVSLGVTTNFGCSASVQKTVTITTAPPVNFSNAPACINQPTQFTDASGAGVKSWLWKIDNSTYIINNPIHTFTTAGSHTVQLTITGANDCIAQMIKTVLVPVAVTPNFSIENACSEKPSLFLDITSGGADPVVTGNWDFGGMGSATGASPQYTFAAGGNYSVKLNTTHQSGCVYLVTKTITISTSPKSVFTSSAEGGPPPLTVEFANSSTVASSYLWKFNDKENTTSLLAEPSFTFTELGEYQVELTSIGQQGCTDTFSKPIYIVEPRTDLSLTGLELLPDPTSGTLRPLVTIKNNGNIAVANVSILIDLSGGGSIKEKMQINLQPNQSFTQALVSELLPKGLSYVCAQVNVEKDENLFDNKKCSTLAEDVILFAPYPNPSQGQLYIDWIAASGDVANIVIFNSTGGNAYDKKITAAQPGLSQIILDISTLGPGIYFAVFNYGGFTKTHRFMMN
jgi:PKD repeat protein